MKSVRVYGNRKAYDRTSSFDREAVLVILTKTAVIYL